MQIDYFAKQDHPPSHHITDQPHYVLAAHNIAFSTPTNNHIPQTSCKGMFLPHLDHSDPLASALTQTEFKGSLKLPLSNS